MQAYLIDPYEKSITTVSYSGHFEDINRLIGSRVFDLVHLNGHGDDAYVDDEGLLRGDLSQERFIKFASYPEPIVGKALVLGSTEDGESAEPKMSHEELSNDVQFWDIFDVYDFIERSTTKEESE
jgi:hypothetical protein